MFLSFLDVKGFFPFPKYPTSPNLCLLAKAAQRLHLLEANGEELVVSVVRSRAEPQEYTVVGKYIHVCSGSGQEAWLHLLIPPRWKIGIYREGWSWRSARF